jgi:hypothetical protein
MSNGNCKPYSSQASRRGRFNGARGMLPQACTFYSSAKKRGRMLKFKKLYEQMQVQ